MFGRKKKKEKKGYTVDELIKAREASKSQEFYFKSKLKEKEDRINELIKQQEFLCPQVSPAKSFYDNLISETYHNPDLHSAISAKISEIKKEIVGGIHATGNPNIIVNAEL